MNIRKVPLHEIKPYENNAKQHPVKQLEAIVNSIKEFGFRQPIVVDRNNVIIAGHARYEAAAAMGMNEVPCEYADDLTPQQVNAYRILDNEIANLGYVDVQLRARELEALPDFDFTPFNVEFKTIDKEVEALPEVEKSIREMCKECNGTGYLD